jgi:hypothetical protein
VGLACCGRGIHRVGDHVFSEVFETEEVMSVIENLAAAFGPNLPGIDWAALEQDMNATAAEIVMDTTPTQDGKTTMGAHRYQWTMLEAYEKAEHAMQTIDMPWDIGTSQAMKAWDDAKKQTIEVGGVALAGFKQSVSSFLPEGMSFDLKVDDFRAIVASTYMTAMYGALLHTRRAFQKAGVEPEIIIEHATQVTKAFQLLDLWFAQGLLEPLKKKNGSVGAIPVVAAGALVIVATAIIAAIAWTMVANRRISETNRVMKNICDQATATGDKELLSACVELSEQNQVAVQSGPSSFGPNAIFKWLAVAVGAYAVITIMPPIVRSMEAKSKRRLLREAAR